MSIKRLLCRGVFVILGCLFVICSTIFFQEKFSEEGKLKRFAESEVARICGRRARAWAVFQKKFPNQNDKKAIESKEWQEYQSWGQPCIDAQEGLKDILVGKTDGN